MDHDISDKSLWHSPLVALSLCAGLAGGIWAGAVSSYLAHRARPAPACACALPARPVLPVPLVLPPPPAPAFTPACRPELGRAIRWEGTHYEIDRALIDRLLSEPPLPAASARIVPAIQSGRPAGFRIYAIRPCSLLDRLGLRNGDRVKSVNGVDLASPERALAAYQGLRQASDVVIQLERRGEDLALRYHVH